MAADFSQALGKAGAPVEVTLSSGKVIKMRHFVQEDKSALEQVVKDRARAELLQMKAQLEDSEFKLAMGAFLDNCSSGTYQFGGEVSMKFMRSLAGTQFIMSRLMNVKQNEILNLLGDPYDQKALQMGLKQVLEESFPKVGTPKPNPEASAEETTEATATN